MSQRLPAFRVGELLQLTGYGGETAHEYAPLVLSVLDTRTAGAWPEQETRRIAVYRATTALAGAAYTGSIAIAAAPGREIRVRRVQGFVRDAQAPFSLRSLTSAELRACAWPDADTLQPGQAGRPIVAAASASLDDVGAVDPAVDYDLLAAIATATRVTYSEPFRLGSRMAEPAAAYGPLVFTYTRTATGGDLDQAVLLVTIECAPQGVQPQE